MWKVWPGELSKADQEFPITNVRTDAFALSLPYWSLVICHWSFSPWPLTPYPAG